MTSKSLIVLGLFALLFVVSAVVAASERQPGVVKSESEKTEGTEQFGGGGHKGYNIKGFSGGDPYEGGNCRHGCCQLAYSGCSECCSYAGEAVQTKPGN
ncbi:unnamed protein product [Eruca vesicaria subsp. sativa]|uniref:Glycine-rich protein n=1 Tax=Eruca vesicaria subsp. sativa TaxID=29727 RepID=A0ABC8LEB5_ERUVS|nr:unnamed protein product [Eruca vesicaria subsp. sativa]